MGICLRSQWWVRIGFCLVTYTDFPILPYGHLKYILFNYTHIKLNTSSISCQYIINKYLLITHIHVLFSSGYPNIYIIYKLLGGYMDQDKILKNKAQELLFKSMENADQSINIQVENGYMTLTGIVDVLSEKKAVEELVRSIPGVKSVENALTIGMDRNIADKDITEEIINRFKSDRRLEDDNIGATTKQGIAQLQGSVKQLAEANIAFELASSVMGVKDVINQLKIESPNSPHDDASLTNAIERSFSLSGKVSAQDIKTQCYNGTVYLDGTVDTPEEKKYAEQLAATVPGIKKVANRLVTRHGNTTQDNELTNKLREELRTNPWATPGAQIEAYVIDNTAFLGGEVYSIEARIQAERTAASLDGITQVQNEIEVAKH